MSDIESRAGQLAQRFEAARPSERATLRPEMKQVIRTLKARHQPIPFALCRVEAELEQDAFDDMIDNMPV